MAATSKLNTLRQVMSSVVKGPGFDRVLSKEKCRNGKLTANNAVDALKQCSNNYPNIQLLLEVLTTLPVTTTSVERSFTMLRRLKTWLRSTMVEDRLTGLALLASCTDITVTPDALTMVEADNGRCVCELKLSEEHQNRGGMMHGGLTCTLVDVVSTSALMANDGTSPGVSVDLNVSFMRAAKVGEEIVIDAKTVKLGKTLAFLTVEIKNKSDSKIIATGNHTKYIGG